MSTFSLVINTIGINSISVIIVRYSQYIKSGVPIHLIVPSSTCMRNGHIMRMFYLIKRLSSLLNKYFVPLDPIMYGWKEKGGYLLPNKCVREIPNKLINMCGCNDCSSKRCGCRRVVFCGCAGSEAIMFIMILRNHLQINPIFSSIAW